MHVSIADFWKLVVASELASPPQCREWEAGFAGQSGPADVKTLAKWLVTGGKLTRYQAALLAAGKPGPFVFGPFVVVDRIEKGRLAKVFRAQYKGDQQVLLIFLSQLSGDPHAQQELVERSAAASAVKNPHVSRTYRAGRQRSQAFIVVEDLQGNTLEELLPKLAYTPQTACQLGFQLALGLVALHEAHIAHGAVCPRNIWIGTNGAAKLLQFPLTQPATADQRLQSPLVEFLALELAAGQQSTPLGDLYALGCLLYRLLAGHVPFAGGSAQQMLAQRGEQLPPRLDTLNPRVPAELGELVEELLATDPRLRCPTASQAAHVLAAFATDNRGRGGPPKLESTSLSEGYGAWSASDWESPPQEVISRPAPTAHAKGGDPQSERPASAAAAVKQAVVISAVPTTPATSPADVPSVAVVDSDSTGAATVRLKRRRTGLSAIVGVGVALVLVVGLVLTVLTLDRGEQAAPAPAAPSPGPARTDELPTAASDCAAVGA